MNTLDQIAARVDASMKASLMCSMLLSLPPDEGRTALAKKEADRASEAAGNALETLQAEGATISPIPATGGVPLDKLDTPANRALLACLDQAVQLAESVDAERGYSNPESHRLAPSDCLGVDLAEHIGQIRARVYLECHGANSVFACEKHDGKGLE